MVESGVPRDIRACAGDIWRWFHYHASIPFTSDLRSRGSQTLNSQLSTMSNALVIGMGGVGSVIGQKLHDYDCFEQIFLADIDPTFARHLHGKTVDSRFEVATLNAMETQKLAAFMREKKIAVALNACTWQTNHSVLEACYEAGAHYLDMAADIYSPPGVKRSTKNSY